MDTYSTNRVLVFEDSEEQWELIRIVCKDLPFPVELIHFSNGNRVLEFLIREGTERVSFLLTDLNNPHMDGDQLIQMIRTVPHVAHLPAVVFSSSDERRDIQKCIKAGANAFVFKPTDFEEFEAVIFSIFDFWCQKNKVTLY